MTESLAEKLYNIACSLETLEDDEEAATFEELDPEDRLFYEAMAQAAQAETQKRVRCTPGQAVDAYLAGAPVWRDGELTVSTLAQGEQPIAEDGTLTGTQIIFYPGDVWEIPVHE